MDKTNANNLGTVSIQDDCGNLVREIAITDLVRAVFKDHRLCTVARTEENSFILQMENPQSSGRLPVSKMHLSEDSLLAVVSGVFLFYMHHGIDINQKMKELADSDTIEYEFNIEENKEEQ